MQGDINYADMQTEDPQTTLEVQENEQPISNSSLDKATSVPSNIVEECTITQGDVTPVNMETEDA